LRIHKLDGRGRGRQTTQGFPLRAAAAMVVGVDQGGFDWGWHLDTVLTCAMIAVQTIEYHAISSLLSREVEGSAL